MDLILVRHATSTRVELGVWSRLFDAPLKGGFEAELAGTASEIGGLTDPMVFSSPLARCRATAAHIYPRRPVHIVDSLRAYHSGRFEGATEAEVLAAQPGYADLSYQDKFRAPRFGEESIAEQTERVLRGFAEVLKHDAATTVIVAHYSSINIMANTVEPDPSGVDRVYDLKAGGYWRTSVDAVALRSRLAGRGGDSAEEGQ